MSRLPVNFGYFLSVHNLRYQQQPPRKKHPFTFTMIIFGTRLFGGTDTVPGLFHVQTKFFHIDFMPLFPLSSYLILQQNGRNFRGIEIPINGKSVSLAYIRAVACLAAFISFIFMIVMFPDGSQYSPVSEFILALFSFFIFVSIAAFLMWHKSFRNASYERATEIVALLGPNGAAPALQRIVDRHFCRDVAVMADAVIHEEQYDVTNDFDLYDLPFATPNDLEFKEVVHGEEEESRGKIDDADSKQEIPSAQVLEVV